MLVNENEVGNAPPKKGPPSLGPYASGHTSLRLRVCAHAWTGNGPGRSGACDEWARWRDGRALFVRCPARLGGRSSRGRSLQEAPAPGAGASGKCLCLREAYFWETRSLLIHAPCYRALSEGTRRSASGSRMGGSTSDAQRPPQTYPAQPRPPTMSQPEYIAALLSGNRVGHARHHPGVDAVWGAARALTAPPRRGRPARRRPHLSLCNPGFVRPEGLTPFRMGDVWRPGGTLPGARC